MALSLAAAGALGGVLYGVGGSTEAWGSCIVLALLAFFLMGAMLSFFSTAATLWRVRCIFGGGDAESQCYFEVTWASTVASVASSTCSTRPRQARHR